MVKTFKTPAAKKLCSIVLAAAMFISLTLSSSLYVSAEEEPAGNVHELTVSAEEVLAAIENGTAPLGESGLPALPTDEDRIPQEAGPVNGESALVNGTSAVAGEPQVPETAALIDRIDIPFGSSNLRSDLLEHLENNLPVRFFDHDDIGCSDCQALVTVSPETKQVSIIAINASEDETHTFRLTIADKDNVPLALQDVSKEATNAEIKVFEGDIDNADIPKGVQVEILDTTTEKLEGTASGDSHPAASENSTSSSSQPAASENASSAQSGAASEEVASESVPSAESSDIPVEIASETEAAPLPLLAAFSAAFENTFTEQAKATGVDEETLYEDTSYEPSIEALSVDINVEDASEDASSGASSIAISSEEASSRTSLEKSISSDIPSQELSSSSETSSSRDKPSESSSEAPSRSEPADEPMVPGDSEIVKTTALLISTATASMSVAAFDETLVAVKSGITMVEGTYNNKTYGLTVTCHIDKNFVLHGDPIFVYALKKAGTSQTYIQVVRFTGGNVEDKTVSFDKLPAGKYTLTQQTPMRFKLVGAEIKKAKGNNNNWGRYINSDEFNLNDDYLVKFKNEKQNEDWFSGSDVVVNNIIIHNPK